MKLERWGDELKTTLYCGFIVFFGVVYSWNKLFYRFKKENNQPCEQHPIESKKSTILIMDYILQCNNCNDYNLIYFIKPFNNLIMIQLSIYAVESINKRNQEIRIPTFSYFSFNWKFGWWVYGVYRWWSRYRSLYVYVTILSNNYLICV